MPFHVQGVPLFSMDSKVFLWVQSDGNLVLYNLAAFESYGATTVAAIWGSNTYGATPQPFELAMQPVRTPALFALHAAQSTTSNSAHRAFNMRDVHIGCRAQDCSLVLYSGGASYNALFDSDTFGQGSPPCRMVVSSAGGGSFAVLDSANAVLFSRGAYSPAGTPPGTLPSGGQLAQACSPPLHAHAGAADCVPPACTQLEIWLRRARSCTLRTPRPT